MDASHIVVVALTGITLALLVWVEIRSRRNSAAEQQSHLQGGSVKTEVEQGSTSCGSTEEEPRHGKKVHGQLRNG